MKKEINYKNILSDFQKNFDNKVCVIETNYKKLNQIKVLFKTTQLPHLMGFHKITNGSATKIIKRINDESFTFENTKHHPNFFQIQDRLLGYSFLKEIFYDHKTEVMIVTRDMKPNTMRLDIVFFKNEKNKDIILGLRKESNTPYFVPTTLYKTKTSRNLFRNRRRTKINKIYWE